MAQQEGYSTVRPPLFSGEDFGYWKGRMEVHLKTQVESWIIIQTGFALPTEDGELVPCDKWDAPTKRKIEADAKATQTLQCGLTKEELNRVGPFNSAKELWNKLIELHEGTSDTKVSKRDLLLNKLYNIKMQESESASQLHARIQDLLNGLHAIGQKVENRDIIRYALNAFPRSTLWASMVDAYKVSKDLSLIRLDELFSEFELHEQTNARPVEKSIALVAGTSKTRETKTRHKTEPETEGETDSEDDDETTAELVNLVRKLYKKKGFTKRDIKKVTQSKTKQASPSSNTKAKFEVTCYGCNKKGHIKANCPNQKEVKKQRKKKALQATWDESSSEDSDEESEQASFLALPARFLALPAREDVTEIESENESEAESERSHGSVSDSEGSNSTVSPSVAKLHDLISYLFRKLAKSNIRVKSLQKEVELLKEKTTSSSLTESVQIETSTQVLQLEEENSNLKTQVKELKDTLERFTLGSKNLDLILGKQRAVYNRSGLGYKAKNRYKSYMSLVNRTNRKPVQAWVPKSNLVNQVGPNKYWIPKDKIHYLDQPYQGYDPGKTNRKTIYIIR